jgi:hypothetical protein
MAEMTSRRRFVVVTTVWTLSAIMGLTVAILAVGWLGLWVAVGVFACLGTTVAGGVIGQVLLASDFDAMIEARRSGSGGGDTSS